MCTPLHSLLAAVALVVSLALTVLAASLAVASADPASARAAASAPAVGVRVLQLVDRTRGVRLPDGSVVPRTLVTSVRYPALGPQSGADLLDAPAFRARAPLPLIVFGHGFAVTPRLYGRLLDYWASAGYVVVAPVFPLANANAPGGPDESDIVNQPRDMSFVISALLAANSAPTGPLSGLIDPAHVAVAGQSDGGVTALAAAYGRRFRDPRVGAAVILSGAEMSGVGGYDFAAGPPLLATQGTADTTNEPRFTYAFFHAASRPKYLLRLLGAEHLPPYTREQPQLGIVERVTVAFLDGYLKREPESLARLPALGDIGGAAALIGDP